MPDEIVLGLKPFPLVYGYARRTADTQVSRLKIKFFVVFLAKLNLV